MEITIPFTNENYQQVRSEYEISGWRLKEEQKHFDGWNLIFTDEPYVEPEPVRDLAAEIDELKARVEEIGIIRKS